MNCFLKNLIIVSVFIVPLSSMVHVPGTIVWYPVYLSFLLIGFFALSAYLWHFNIWLSLLTAFSSFSYIFITHQHPRSLMCLVSSYLGVYFIYFVSKLGNTKKVVWCLLGMGILQFILVVVQKLNLDPIFHKIGSNNSDVVGFAGSHNQLGVYYAALAPVFLSFNPFSLIFSFLPIFWSNCSSAMIGAITAVSCYFFFIFKIKTLIIPAIILLIIATQWFRFDPISFGVWGQRGLLWKMTIQQAMTGKAIVKTTETNSPSDYREVEANSWLGWGLGSFFLISPNTQFDLVPRGNSHRYEHAHNDLVEALFDLGRVGFFLVVGLIGSVVVSFTRCLNKTKALVTYFSSLVAQSVASLGVYVVHAPLSFYMLCLTLGLFYAELNNANKSKSWS